MTHTLMKGGLAVNAEAGGLNSSRSIQRICATSGQSTRADRAAHAPLCGRDVSRDELMTLGERIWNLGASSTSVGVTAATDTVRCVREERFDEGPAAGR